jgi:hypothetical protein
MPKYILGCAAYFRAKLSENKAFLRFEAKKVVFSLCSHASKTLQKAKTMKAKHNLLSEKLQFQ